MRRARSWILLVAAGSASLSCNQIFGLSAAHLGNDGGSNEGGSDAGMSEGLPGSDGGMSCLPCGAHVCDTTTGACVPCTAHSQCASEVCLPTGDCADESMIAYAAGSGTDPSSNPGSAGDCTYDLPCRTLDEALAALDGRTTVKVMSSIDTNTTISAGSNAKITIIGDVGVALIGSDVTSTPTLTLSTPTDLTIQDIEITTGSVGISVTGGGGSNTIEIVHVVIHDNGLGVSTSASTAAAFTLELARSVITANRKGGLDIEGVTTYRVVGNAIYGNGQDGSFGGMLVDTTLPASGTAEFNSIAFNSSEGVAAGLTCTGSAHNDSNIIADNIASGSAGAQQISVAGTCQNTYTVLYPTGSAGLGNSSNDPEFKSGSDLHLGSSSSAAIHMAAPNADITGDGATDIDGVPRVQPADCGAYVFVAH